MKLATVKKYVLAFVLMILFVSQLSSLSAFADDDPNKSVSDYWTTDKDSDVEKDSDTEKKELDNNINAPTADRSSTDKAVGSSVGDYIKVMVALLFVVCLLFGLLKFVNRKNRLYDKNRFMKNMGGISLGQHKSVQLVAVGESYYLIGVGDDIRLLKEITDPGEIDKLVEFYGGDDRELATGMLDQILKKMTGKSPNDRNVQTGESSDFGELFKTRLDEMKEERNRHISRLTEKERNQDE
ncbi:flagellar biosynthetic protein FliO [Sporosarcina sp. YIM B06819]|uniref:flagellar biosynthetic protein FliO n=1 Tax=Sporosarcina sp. YIM B06819 TaxID=3081769 RepID=UPI00298C4785|nr:flagellar biosynthetic protein FliO [Sporosarcina sp. YIM B06819]